MLRWTDFLISSLSRIYGLLPYWCLKTFAKGFAWFWFDVVRFRRYTILRNLTIAFPQMSHVDRYQLARQSLVYQVLVFLDVLLIPGVRSNSLDRLFQFHGIEHFKKVHEKGKGVFLMSLHIGSGDLGVTALALKGLPLSLISKKFKNAAVNNFWFGLRERNGVKFIDAHGSKTAFEIMTAMKNNRGVVFVIDQFMGKPYGIETTFFGRKTGTAYGLALFAIKAKAPVIPLYTYQDQTGVHHIVFGDPVPVIENENRDLQILQMTESYNRTLEEIIKAHPEQWMWIHRRWKKFE